MNSDTALERVNYFTGQLLNAADFQTEQDYFLARFRRHNRYLHGWGVVFGLTVTLTRSSEIIINPGLAIDCIGNEIQLGSPVTLPLPNSPDRQFVILQYAETLTSPIPTVKETPHEPVDEFGFSRIRESFQIKIIETDPTSDHQGEGPGTPGCGCFHPVCIAGLRKSVKGWKVELLGRRSV
jgi:hypothetical protein